MKYEKGDKVVVEIVSTDTSRRPYEIGNSFNTVWLEGNQILGKLEDFQPAQEKIKMTVEEKKEFDKLLEEFKHSNTDLNDLLVDICDYSVAHPVLHTKLFENSTTFLDRKKQLEFARALEHPDLIEVVKEKKYYIKILGQYLVYSKSHKMGIELVNKRYADQFSLDLIREMNGWEKFKEIDLLNYIEK